MTKAMGQTLDRLCEFVRNNGFENVASCGTIPPSAIAPFGQMGEWTTQIGSPDVHSIPICSNGNLFQLNTLGIYGSNATTIVNPPTAPLNTTTPNNHIVGLECKPTNNEAITQQIAYSLIPNKRYRIVFNAKNGDDLSYYSGGNPSSRIVFYSSTSTNIPAVNSGLNTLSSLGGIIFLTSSEINTLNFNPANPWFTYTATFTFTGTTNHNRIYIGTELLSGQTGNYTYIDDISIQEVPEAIIGNNHLCVGTTTTLTNATSGGIWSSNNNGIATVSSTGVVTAINAGNVTISYRVNNLTGSCDGITEFNLTIANPPTSPTITNPNPTSYCQNATTSLLNAIGVSGATLNWFPSQIPNTSVVGNFNYTVTQTVNGCTSLPGTITVNINPVPIVASIVGTNLPICIGSNETFTNSTPGGVWSSSNTAIATVNNTGLITTVATGIASIIYTVTDALSSCVNSIAKNINIQVCDPCLVAMANATPITGVGVTNGYYSNKVYHISNNTIFYGHTQFSDCEVIIEPNITITVATNASLVIANCYFHTCNGMWQGINVLENGKLIIKNFDGTEPSIIADAVVAINFDFPSGTVNPYFAEDRLLIAEGVIFNRNQTSIQISNYLTDPYAYTTFPFQIMSCMFTSREIPYNYGSLNWPSIVDFYEIKNASTFWNMPDAPEILSSPLINDVKFPDNTPNAFLKISGVQAKPSFGIVLKNIGTPQNQDAGIHIGDYLRTADLPMLRWTPPIVDISDAMNVFDNIDIAIDAQTTNLKVSNSIFQKPHSINSNAIGINLYNGKNYKAIIDNISIRNRVKNAFFDLNTAIYADGYENLEIINNVFRSSHSIANSGVNSLGSQAIYATSNGYSNLKITNNEITNITNGIYVDNTNTNDNLSAAIIDVNNNTLQAIHPNITALGTEYLHTAITLVSENPGSEGFEEQPSVNCNNNIITDANFGIKASYWLGKNTIINNNTINIVNLPNSPTNIWQYGISLEGGIPFSNASGNQIQNNIITGNCLTCNQTGIMLYSQLGTNIGCNNVSNLQNGFRFLMPNTATRFWDNFMSPSNQYGLTLEKNGSIGRQGNPRSKGLFNGCTSNNSWGGNNNDWLSQNHFKTYVNNSIASLSKLYVKPNAWMNPDLAGKATSSYPYQSSNSPAGSKSIYVIADDGVCSHCSFNNPVQMEGRAAEQEMDEDIADGSVEISGEEAAQQLYVLQQQLYEKLMLNQSLLDSNPILQSFVQNNTWSSFDFIYYTAKYIAREDWATVNMLLSFFPSNNQLDENYYNYYSWLYDLSNNNLSNVNPNDVFALANQCPATHGTVVFAARNLYNRLKRQTHYFEDNCSDGITASRMSKTQFVEIELPQTIEVFPNPVTNGLVNIKLPKTNEGHWQISIINTFGKTITQQLVANGTNVTAFSINNSKGLHTVKVINTVTGKQFINKLIVQ